MGGTSNLSLIKKGILADDIRQDVNAALASEPIAIVGMGCRLPAGIDSAQSYWEFLTKGGDAISEVPQDRWDTEGLYSTDPDARGKMYTRLGAFVENATRFDAGFFGISPREARQMDPQQGLSLHVAWEALEEAGYTLESLSGSRTGVFIGNSGSEWAELHMANANSIDAYSGTGGQSCVIANRISHFLNLQGPSLTVDTACSSSLVALHLACQSLRARETNVAIAGGVSYMMTPNIMVAFSKSRILSPNGRSRSFDKDADGYGRGEGCGMVVLKRLVDAIADEDVIHAVIRSSAVNQDGRTNGLSAPSGEAQEAVIRDALQAAMLQPSDITNVEAHGTGTVVGDTIEYEALARSYGRKDDDADPCFLGAVKTNIGHLEAAAGIASVIKVVLCLRHRSVPPNRNFNEVPSSISQDDDRLLLARDNLDWNVSQGSRIAAVSGFGFGGTNAHVLVEEPPRLERRKRRAPPFGCLLPISARDPQALRELMSSYHELALQRAQDGEASLSEICGAAAVHRTHHPIRAAVQAQDLSELAELLEAEIERSPQSGHPAATVKNPKVVLVFSGQGQQAFGMARQLRELSPVFADKLAQCDEIFRGLAGWSIIESLDADVASCRLDETAIAQPAILSVQLALAALWESVGVVADATVGHSVGEIAAACAAGVLSLEQALHVAHHRGALMQAATGLGKMLSVGLPASRLETRIAYEGLELSIAAINDPDTTVVSGPTAALDALVQWLQAEGIEHKYLPVDYAFHSEQMRPCGERLVERLQGLSTAPAKCHLVSTVTGTMAGATDYNAAYWGENVVAPVRFADAVSELLGWGATTFVEVSAHPVLGVSLSRCIRSAGADATIAASLRHGADDGASLLSALGHLYVAGHRIAWDRVYPDSRNAALPPYPFQGDDVAGSALVRLGDDPDQGGGALGSRVIQTQTPNGDRQQIWLSSLSIDGPYHCDDHRVRRMAVLPGAAYVDLALRSVEPLSGTSPVVVEDLTFERVLDLPEEGARGLQVVVDFSGADYSAFRVLAREGRAKDTAENWNVQARGRIRQGDGSEPATASETLSALQARCTEPVSRERHYDEMGREGLHYGPAYQTVESIHRRDGEVLVRLQPSDVAIREADQSRFHPTILDGCFQAMSAAMEGYGSSETTYLPASVGRLTFTGPTGKDPLWARIWLTPEVPCEQGEVSASIELFGDDEKLLAEVRDFRVRSVAEPKTALLDSLYELAWFAEPLDQPAAAPRSADDRPWLIFADRQGFATELVKHLQRREQPFELVRVDDSSEALDDGALVVDPMQPDAFDKLLRDAGERGWQNVVYLWGLDADQADADAAVPERVETSLTAALHMVQALARKDAKPTNRLWIVTQGAQAMGIDAVATTQAPLWGLGRTVALERPELRCGLIDVRNSTDSAALHAELSGQTSEDQVLLRGRARYVARYERVDEDDLEEIEASPAADGSRFRLEIDDPGALDRLQLHAVASQPLGPGEVEIEVAAAGLNFLDVLSALGMIPAEYERGPELGAEVAGTIAAVGSEVTRVRPGQRVMAMVASGFASHVVADERLVFVLPDWLSVDQAATIPIAFATAWQALVHSAHLAQGERVLIHAGAGGVGMAAIQIAQSIGAEVFATAGRLEKRELLTSMGVQHFIYSRSLGFADDVLERTNDEGVDVVLNSLAGEFIPKGMSILRRYGRFIELGKRDYFADHQIGLRPFLNNLTFSLVDLRAMMYDRVDQLHIVLEEVMDAFAGESLRPLPHRTFPITEAAEAFRFMAQAKHTGKIVLQVDDATPDVVDLQRLNLRDDASYLITGGLGGLGLEVAQWLAARGAGQLVLLGRSKPSVAQQQGIDSIAATGCRVAVLQADVSVRGEVQTVLQEVASNLPPLRGVLHAAGVLQDGMLDGQSAESFRKVLGPKVRGGWALHECTQDLPLDFFVLFSSAASVVGSPGQANYAAANAFLDALAHLREQEALPALSVNWGAWSEVGMAASQSNRGQRLRSRGALSIAPARGLKTLEALMLRLDTPQVAVTPMDWPRWAAAFPTEASRPLYSHCISAQDVSTSDSLDVLRQIEALAPEERGAAVVDYLTQELAEVMRLPKSRLDPHTPIKDLGVDSLMMVELINRVETGLGHGVPREELLGDATVATIATFLLEALGDIGGGQVTASGEHAGASE